MKYDIVLKRRNAQDNGYEEVTISAKDFAAGNFAALNPPEPKVEESAQVEKPVEVLLPAKSPIKK